MLTTKRFGAFGLFSLFIFWVIWQADINGTNYVFDAVKQVPFRDKIGHFSLYGVLALLLDRALNGKNEVFKYLQIPKAFIWVMTFAVLEELTQIWLPTRNFDLLDVLADFLGVTVFIASYRIYKGEVK